VKKKILSAAIMLISISLPAWAEKFDPKNPPAPGSGLGSIMAGSELQSFDDKYSSMKKFWGDDVVSRGFENASNNTSSFVANMNTKYGFTQLGDANWQLRLSDAVHAAQVGDWAKVISNCTAALSGNPKALDAYLLRSAAYNRLNQNDAALNDVKTIYELRKENHYSSGPYDAVLNGNAKPAVDTTSGFMELQEKLKKTVH
jgi:hypothetical protein